MQVKDNVAMCGKKRLSVYILWIVYKQAVTSIAVALFGNIL